MNANMLQVTTPQSRLPELIAAAGERASMRHEADARVALAKVLGVPAEDILAR